MNSEKCNEIMDSYLELDKGEHIPFSMTAHLLFCRKCRREVRLMARAEKLMSEPLKIPVPLSNNTIETVLRTIDPEFSDTKLKNPISMRHWVISGILMILFMFVFVFSKNISNNLEVAMSLVFAGSVIAYTLTFVFSNIDFFVKKINTIKTAV
jgi:hypothetical protein